MNIRVISGSILNSSITPFSRDFCFARHSFIAKAQRPLVQASLTLPRTLEPSVPTLGLSKTFGSQLSTLNSQFSIPHSSFPIPHSSFLITRIINRIVQTTTLFASSGLFDYEVCHRYAVAEFADVATNHRAFEETLCFAEQYFEA